MTLPPRKSKAPKRSERWRSQSHRAFVRGFACSVCGSEANIEFAHVRLGSHTGISQKPDDWRGVPLCGGPSGCHTLQHAQGEQTFWRTYEIASGQTVDDLIDALCKASPKASEIRQVRNG